MVGCLYEGDGPGWETPAPGAWGLPLDQALLEAVERQVDVGALVDLAGQRGFLSSQNLLTDRGSEGPLVMVAGGAGFTPWSRDSIEVLRAAGARIRRLDLVEDEVLPAEAAGLVLAGHRLALQPDRHRDEPVAAARTCGRGSPRACPRWPWAAGSWSC